MKSALILITAWLLSTMCIILPSYISTGGVSTPPSREEWHLHLKDTFANSRDNNATPRILLIWDSISIGYTVQLRKIFDGKASVHYIPENVQAISYGIANLEEYLTNIGI